MKMGLSLPVRILLLISVPAGLALYTWGHREAGHPSPTWRTKGEGNGPPPPLPFQLVVHPLKTPRLVDVPGPRHRDSIESVAGPDTVTLRRKLYGFRDYAWIEKEARGIAAGIKDPLLRHEKLHWFASSLTDILWKRDTLGMRQTLEDWVAQKPQSALAHQVLARFYAYLAWEFRGTKFANEVPEEAWEPFHGFLARAVEAADASLRIDPGNPLPYITKLMAARADGTEKEEMEAIYRRGAAIAPWSYPLRLNKLIYLQPRWNGSYEESFAFARESLKDTLLNPKFKQLLIEANEDALWDYDPRKGKPPSEDQDRMIKETDVLWRSLAIRFPEDVKIQINYVGFTHAYYLDEPFLEQMARVGKRWTPTEKWKTRDGYAEGCANMYFNAGKRAPVEKALAYFERAAAMNPVPTWVNPNYHLAMRLLSIGDFMEAERQFKIVLAGKPTYACEVLAYISLLNAQFKRDTAAAIHYAREIFKDMPVQGMREWAVEYVHRLGATPEG